MKVLEDFFESLGIEERKKFLATDGIYYKVESGLLFTLDEDWVLASVEKHIQLISGEIKSVWKPDYGEVYITPQLDTNLKFSSHTWYDDEYDYLLLRRGLVFKTKEEAVNVANEMLKVTKQD